MREVAAMVNVDQLLVIVESLSMPVKAGWGVFLVWLLLLVAWYRRGRGERGFQPLPPLEPERRSWAPRPKATPGGDVDLGHTAGASSSGPHYS
jgi:hypothetical protein